MITLLILAIGYAISWAVTVGIIYLITVCFALEFNLLIATGIWLLICLIKAVL